MRWGLGREILRRITGSVEALLHLAFGIETEIQRGVSSGRNHGSLALKRGVKSSTGQRERRNRWETEESKDEQIGFP